MSKTFSSRTINSEHTNKQNNIYTQLTRTISSDLYTVYCPFFSFSTHQIIILKLLIPTLFIFLLTAVFQQASHPTHKTGINPIHDPFNLLVKEERSYPAFLLTTTSLRSTVCSHIVSLIRTISFNPICRSQKIFDAPSYALLSLTFKSLTCDMPTKKSEHLITA